MATVRSFAFPFHLMTQTAWGWLSSVVVLMESVWQATTERASQILMQSLPCKHAPTHGTLPVTTNVVFQRLGYVTAMMIALTIRMRCKTAQVSESSLFCVSGTIAMSFVWVDHIDTCCIIARLITCNKKVDFETFYN